MKQILGVTAPDITTAVESSPVIRPVFFVRVLAGEEFEDRSFEPPETWLDIYQTIASTLMTVVRMPGIASRFGVNPQKSLILFVEADQSPADTRIGSAVSVRDKIRGLVLDALEREAIVLQVELLGSEEDRGHLQGTVLMVEGFANADALCEEAVKREVKLTGGVKFFKPADGFEPLRTALRELFANAAESYEQHRPRWARLNDEVRKEFAKALEPALNTEAKRRPQASYEEKKELAKWVNAELRRFGLALESPNTNEPCLLQAYQGNNPAVGRFRFDFTDPEGHRRQPYSSASLPDLKLVLDDLTRIPYGQRGRAR